MIDYFLSISDLMLDEEFRNNVKVNDISTLELLLFKYGMDTAKNYEITESINHRNLQNQVVFCPRIEGFSRLDVAWVKSGMASLEVIAASSGDYSLMNTMKDMSTVRLSGVIGTVSGYDIKEK